MFAPKKPAIPFLACCATCAYCCCCLSTSLATVTCVTSSLEKLSIEYRIVSMSSFSLVVGGSLLRNCTMIERMCLSCSSTSMLAEAPPEPQLPRPPLSEPHEFLPVSAFSACSCFSF